MAVGHNNSSFQQGAARAAALFFLFLVPFFSLFGFQSAVQGAPLDGQVLGENAYASYFDSYGAEYGAAESYDLSELGVTLHPGSDYKNGADGTPLSRRHCGSLVYRTLQSLPKAHTSHLKHLTLYFSDTGRRGLGGGNTIILRCQNVTDQELVGVLVHEIGHIVDTGVFSGTTSAPKTPFMDGSSPVYANDPSLRFYLLSWQNSKNLQEKMVEQDFVSGYSMHDPFEDFAETYAFYVLHGSDFRALAKENTMLAKKYAFLKDVVFGSVEYGEKSEEAVSRVFSGSNKEYRNYDVTILPYDLKDFFTLSS